MTTTQIHKKDIKSSTWNVAMYEFLYREIETKLNLPYAVKNEKNVSDCLRLIKILGQVDREKHTQIVIPSLSIGPEHLKDIVGILHYETRCLWEVLKAKSPFCHIVYVSAVKMESAQLDHMFALLPDPEKARRQVTFIHVDNDNEEVCLTEKILSDHKVVSQIKAASIQNMTYMTAFLTSNKEHILAKTLGVPLFGHRPELEYLQTKSGNRKLFEAAGVSFADGINDIFTLEQLKNSIQELWSRHQDARRLMIKLDYGVSGKGNAILNLPSGYEDFKSKSKETRDCLLDVSLSEMKFQGTNWDNFRKQIPEGAIVECFLEGEQKSSPSCQAVIGPNGEVEILSTHEQILDDSGMVFLGAKFPANRFHRKPLQEQTLAIGREMAKRGVIGPFSVDFLVTFNQMGRQTHVIEINLRQGGTTHPYHTARLVTDSRFELKSGNLINKNNEKIYYRSNDNVIDKNLKKVSPEEFLKTMTEKGLVYNKETSSGAVFHLLSALKEHGKLGYTVVGTSRRDVNRLNTKVLKALEEMNNG